MILNNPSEQQALGAALTERKNSPGETESEREMAKLGRLMEKNGLDLPKVTHTESAPCL